MIDYFNQHPQIFMVEDEVHFFSENLIIKILNIMKLFKEKNYKNKKFIMKKHHHIVLYYFQ